MVVTPKEGQLLKSSQGPPQEVVQGAKTSLVYIKNCYKAVRQTAMWCKVDGSVEQNIEPWKSSL